MGPTKVIIKNEALYDVKTGKLIQDGSYCQIWCMASHQAATRSGC